MVWGSVAKIALRKITTFTTKETKNTKILYLLSGHPSSLNTSKTKQFYRNNHFKLCNEFLRSHKLKEINWC